MAVYFALAAVVCASLSTQGAFAEQLYLVTVSDHFSVKQIPFLSSANFFGYNLQVLGMGKAPAKAPGEASIWGRRLGWKMDSIKNFVATLPAEDVVLFLDAYDILLLEPPDVVLAKYTDLRQATGKQLWLAAEDKPGFRADDFPALEGRKWQYINTGAMIGLASAWQALFAQHAPSIILSDRYASDQDWLIDIYFNTSGLGGLIGYDSDCKLFQVTCKVSPIPSHPACHAAENEVFFEDGHITNKVTGTQPSVLHLPGAGHWAIPHTFSNIMHAPRLTTCHYYEVARAIMPVLFADLEMTGTWGGMPYAAICTDDNLLYHLVTTPLAILLVKYAAVWTALAAALIGGCCFCYCGQTTR